MVKETPNGATSDAARWAALIEAVATRGDREAFATLFEHFAPRIKTFMRRSGASEQSADEFAQEALLAVWSKADCSIPAALVPRRGYSRLPAICASMSSAVKSEPAREYTVEIDPEFHVDEGPQPDAGLAASQLESRVRNALAALVRGSAAGDRIVLL